MTKKPSDYSTSFRIDVTSHPSAGQNQEPMDDTVEGLLAQILLVQQRQAQLLEGLIKATTHSQQQRANELKQWKEANPRLSRACQMAAESLSKIQMQFLESLTDEILDNEEVLYDGDFMLGEFVDRFGPRIAHLNGVLQMLGQLGSGVPMEND